MGYRGSDLTLHGSSFRCPFTAYLTLTKSMALRGVTNAFAKQCRAPSCPARKTLRPQCRHFTPTTHAPRETRAGDQTDQTDFVSDEGVSQDPFNPAERAKARTHQLPPSG